MIEANIALSNRCKELVHSVEQAELWVEDNRDVVRSEADPLLARLRRSHFNAQIRRTFFTQAFFAVPAAFYGAAQRLGTASPCNWSGSSSTW